MIASDGYGLWKNLAPSGSSEPLTRWPETIRSLIGGHLSRTASASPTPSIEPGILTSVKTTQTFLSGFEYSDGLIGIAGKQRMQSRILDEVVRHQEEHWFILDDQDATATRRALLWHISPF
ncbi:hypothetical protein AB7M75_007642 [Bradyrhizobium ottawaense]